MTTHSTARNATAGLMRRPLRVPMAVALLALIVKLPQMIISVVMPAGVDGLTPAGGSLNTFLISAVWLVFSIVLLWLRRWVGLLSAAWFCVVSGVSGISLLTDGLLLWGALQLATSVTAVVGLCLGAVRGAFKGSRW